MAVAPTSIFFFMKHSRIKQEYIACSKSSYCFFETVCICVVLDHDIKCTGVVTVKKKKSFKITLQHSSVLSNR